MTPQEADNAQQWEGMDGGTAFELVGRHADTWDDARELMEAWLRANRATLEQFAQEATDKLIENRAAIAELIDALKLMLNTQKKRH